MPPPTSQVDFTEIAAVLLVAGKSQRLGFPKQTYIYQGESLIKRQFRIMQASQLKKIYLLTGAYRNECVLEMQDETNWQEIYNSHFSLGMGSSIKSAVNYFAKEEPGLKGLLFCVCDQIMLTSQHIDQLAQTFCNQSVATLVASTYSNTIGIPAIFPRKFFPDLLKLEDHQGAKTILRDKKYPCLTVALPGGEIDIDRPEDLVRFR